MLAKFTLISLLLFVLAPTVRPCSIFEPGEGYVVEQKNMHGYWVFSRWLEQLLFYVWLLCSPVEVRFNSPQLSINVETRRILTNNSVSMWPRCHDARRHWTLSRYLPRTRGTCHDWCLFEPSNRSNFRIPKNRSPLKVPFFEPNQF